MNVHRNVLHIKNYQALLLYMESRYLTFEETDVLTKIVLNWLLFFIQFLGISS